MSPVSPDPAPIGAEATGLAGRALLGQHWRILTFLHWRVPVEQVEPMLPPGVRPDVFDGSAWVGLIPFRLTGAWLGAPVPLPWVGTFAETNVRLYSVDDAGRHGVVFRTLESQRLAFVLGARLVLGLPYRWSAMSITDQQSGPNAQTGQSAQADQCGQGGRRIEYRSRRLLGRRRPANRTVVEVDADAPAVDDQLARFLTARWGLHTARLGRSVHLPNEHRPWQLRSARLIELDDDLLAEAGFVGLAAREPDSVLFAEGVQTRFGRGSLVPRG